ncbi:MAG TPA: DNA polymerase IV, partial [Candidatus Acetothermia bacterium]|nr:DNA polymerase IV [Candidatus Acetothermia bacterium]
ETTFSEDLRSPDRIEAEIAPLARRVAEELLDARRVARVIRIKVRYADFRTVTRQTRIPLGTSSPDIIASLAQDLFRYRVPWEDTGIRLLGVGVGQVTEAYAQQLALLCEEAPWREEGA